jgi:hypothetical protein
MRSGNGGPFGLMIVIIGLALAAGTGWAALTTGRWGEYVPTAFVGLALSSFGFSMFSRARRDARLREK